jgi:hypothetical protein
MCIEPAYSIADITYFITDTASPQWPPGWRPQWPPYVATRGCSLFKAASEFTCTVSMPKCVAGAVFQWWVDHIDVVADAAALNVTGFRAPPRLRKAEELQQAADAVAAPDFVVEPRKWGQTRSQYFKTLWAMSGLVFGMFVVSCWMCLLLHLS